MLGRSTVGQDARHHLTILVLRLATSAWPRYVATDSGLVDYPTLLGDDLAAQCGEHGTTVDAAAVVGRPAGLADHVFVT